MFGPTYSGWATPYYDDPRRIAWAEFLRLFRRPMYAIDRLKEAEDAEVAATVRYFLERQSR